jgi:hydrogenase maturation protease
MTDSKADQFLEKMARPGPQEILAAGQRLRPGSQVRLKPQPGGDLLDTALAGRLAVIEGFDEDDAGCTKIAVVVQDDPGRDLGGTRHPAHRFFFTPDEIEPVERSEATPRRVLVAGIGNVFFGDDGFGVAVVERLAKRELPPEMDVVDFGIRGMDLAYALGRPYYAAILVDAVPRGEAPGSLCVIEPDDSAGEGAVPDAHHMDPRLVIRLAEGFGPLPPRVLIVGCEPAQAADDETLNMQLSEPVAAAVEPAAEMVVELAGRLLGAREAATRSDK